MPLGVGDGGDGGGRRRDGRARGRRLQPEGRLADPQQRAGGEGDRALAHGSAVQGGAVGGAEVDDGDPALAVHRDGAVQPGDVGVVQRHVRVHGPADPDPAALQQVDAARVGPADDVQPGGGRRASAVVPVGGRVQRQDRAVEQRRHPEDGGRRVQSLGARVERGRGLPGPRGLAGTTRAGRQGACHRTEGCARGCGDQHVAGARRAAAARPENGQPDLHLRPRSLLPGSTEARAPDPTPPCPGRRHVQERTGGLPLLSWTSLLGDTRSATRILPPAADSSPPVPTFAILNGQHWAEKATKRPYPAS